MNRLPPTRRLSVGTTLYKRVVPWLFLAGGTLALATAGWDALTGGQSIHEHWPFAAVGAVGYLVMRLIGAELADEVLDGGDYLVVRKDGIVEQVPLAEIEEIKESIWQRQPPRVELVLRAPGTFGRVITFIPINYTLVPLMRSPLTYELRDRVARASRESRAVKSRHTP